MTVIAGNDPAVTDGHSEDVRGEILQGCPAVADGFGMDDPGLTPDRRIDLRQYAGAVQGVTELGAKEDRQSRHRHQELGMRRQPLGTVGADAPAGHHVMNVRVILQSAAPGVQHTEEAALSSADKLGIGGQSLDRLAGRLEQRSVGDALMTANPGATQPGR